MCKDLIEPLIFIPKGCCPRCLSPLTIFESEIAAIELDKDGLPINHDIKYHRLYGKCQNCGLDFNDIAKDGMGFKIHSKFLDILEEGFLEELLEKENPFAYNINRKEE